MIHESISLKYEPASEPLNISVKWLFEPRIKNKLGTIKPDERAERLEALLAREMKHLIHRPKQIKRTNQHKSNEQTQTNETHQMNGKNGSKPWAREEDTLIVDHVHRHGPHFGA